MKKTRKFISGILALTMVSGLAACSDSSVNGGEADNPTTSAATTTTAVTAEINTEGLKDGEQEVLENAMSQLRDVELENKEIKWLAHYSQNPGTDGSSKSVALEMFEQKYGAHIKDYITTYENRFNDLSSYVLGGEGIDFFPGDDAYNFPKGVISGMFQPVDDYIDVNSPLWQNTKKGMEIFNFGGKHFAFVTNITAEQVCVYNMATIEENGFDDPWELYEAGEWNWDTFQKMLEDFVDEDNGTYGLDGYFYEKALWTSAGAVAVDNVDGHVKSMLNDATLERAENFGYELYRKGLTFNRELFNWNTQPQNMSTGNELFYLVGAWNVSGDPTTWETQIPPEDLGIVPVPSPADSDPYGAATMGGFALCKGAQNPLGVALYAECNIVGSTDEGAVAVSDRKSMDDNQWSQEIVDRVKVCDELVRQYPVYDLAPGSSTDVADYTVNDSVVGLRAPFHGVSDWATQREMLADTIEGLVQEVDNDLQNKIAEFN